ncbi:hypothetical protein Syun_001074 [Stephania yunnanensis]|uniref:WRKY domain-containing protein n=1 Tax=Stephania yunnanensis TaxID=152371 RepID=A0AAP0LIP7_9MAGN
MEIQEAGRVTIAKPIPSRPSCSNYRSFSVLLSGAISNSACDSLSETVLPAIRPKTVRFKPTVDRPSAAIASSQVEVSGAAACLSEKVLRPESKSTVLYKPLAKAVSTKTAHLLANLGGFDFTHQDTTTQLQPPAQHLDQLARHLNQTQVAPNCHVKLPSHVKTNQTIERSKMAKQIVEENQKPTFSTTISDRPSYDGYNWRKYGQKQVKGSEYPRSYYKCTHPNCPVKKKVERSLDGQIAEIVYKGEHNHSKPQPPKRQSSNTPEKGVLSDATKQECTNPLWSNPIKERSEGFEGIENSNDAGFSVSTSYPSKALNSCDLVMTQAFNSGRGTPDNSCGISGDFDEGSRGLDAAEDEPKSKRRKAMILPNDDGTIREPRIVMQNSTDSEILGDGFRWRKYGQKVVKGNPYPRSYYRCTNQKCNVRKHVERALDDPRAFITTYEGKHNHEMPASRNLINTVVSDPGPPAPINNSIQ